MHSNVPTYCQCRVNIVAFYVLYEAEKEYTIAMVLSFSLSLFLSLSYIFFFIVFTLFNTEPSKEHSTITLSHGSQIKFPFCLLCLASRFRFGWLQKSWSFKLMVDQHINLRQNNKDKILGRPDPATKPASHTVIFRATILTCFASVLQVSRTAVISTASCCHDTVIRSDLRLSNISVQAWPWDDSQEFYCSWTLKSAKTQIKTAAQKSDLKGLSYKII